MFKSKSIIIVILSILLFLPTTIANADQRYPFEIKANHILIMDYETGHVLYEKNAREAVAPASLTKIMTMYVIFDALENGEISLEDKVTISKEATTLVPGASRIWAVPGSEVSVEELLIAISVLSANDAGIAIAEEISGSEKMFVQRMNKTAEEIGLEHTNFKNSHGLDQDNHTMSAYDVAKLSQILISDFPQALEYSSITSYTMSDSSTSFVSTFKNLLVNHQNIDGLKTGYTGNAGRCISVTSTINHRRYIIVLMDVEGNTHRETISNRDSLVEEIMYDYIASEFESRKVLNAKEEVKSITISSAKRGKYAVGSINDLEVVTPREHTFLSPHINIDKSISAPLEKGDVVGSIKYKVNGQVALESPLHALEDVPRANFIARGFWGIIDSISNSFSWIINLF
ncbi:D-alanyl-D-alanine carboxypeptidase family protein [Proteinivorax tanatarense]|uniref:serine-type D-Ala-D-Ala carboxypeptidase n=1 Tax=Proteinivorax tanatarense TaxID=1260629 RepID=A0AAU7VQ13_9FIRM